MPALSYGPHHYCVACIGDRRQVRCSFVSSRFPVPDRYSSLDFLSLIAALLLRTYVYVLCADLHKLASVNNKDRPRALSPDANFLVRDGSELISALGLSSLFTLASLGRSAQSTYICTV